MQWQLVVRRRAPPTAKKAQAPQRSNNPLQKKTMETTKNQTSSRCQEQNTTFKGKLVQLGATKKLPEQHVPSSGQVRHHVITPYPFHLVRAGGALELVGGLEAGIAGGAVGGSVVIEVEAERCSLI